MVLYSSNEILYEGKYVVLRQITFQNFLTYFKLIKEKKLSLYRPGIEKLITTEEEIVNFLHFREQIKPPIEIEAFVFKKSHKEPIGIVGLLGIDNFHKKAEITFVLWKNSLKLFFETTVISLKAAFLGLKLEKIFFLVREDNTRFLNFLTNKEIILEGTLYKEALDPYTGKRYNLKRFAIFPEILNHPKFLKLERSFS